MPPRRREVWQASVARVCAADLALAIGVIGILVGADRAAAALAARHAAGAVDHQPLVLILMTALFIQKPLEFSPSRPCC
jgi:hypothetical protein